MPDLLLAEFRRHWIQYRRYPAEAASGVVMMTMMFLGLLAGGLYVAGPVAAAAGNVRAESLMVGYWIWMLTMFVLNEGAGTIQLETMTGTIEQLFMSPRGTLRIILTRSLSAVVFHLTITSSVILIIVAVTGYRLRFPLYTLVPLVIGLFAATGLSLIFGALALVLKKVDQLLNLLRFMLFLPLMVPSEGVPAGARMLLYAFPMTPSLSMLRSLMIAGHPEATNHLTAALLNAAIYFAIGIAAYRSAERFVRSRGLLGQH